MGTGTWIVTGRLRIPVSAKKLVAVRPRVIVTTQTSGETVVVRYRLFYAGLSFSRSKLTEFLSDPIIGPIGYPIPPLQPKPQKLHTIMEEIRPDSVLDVEMNSLQSCTVAPMAGLEALYLT